MLLLCTVYYFLYHLSVQLACTVEQVFLETRYTFKRILSCFLDTLLLKVVCGLLQETGHKVVNHDMPLYFSCSCR